jgi:hypothetical protein
MRFSPGAKLLAALFALAFLCGTIQADFSMKSLSVFVNVNLDGSANVEEQLYVVINGSQSRELYDFTRSAYSDISTWQQRTNLSELRHHMTRAKADISDVRINPQAVDRCSSAIQGLCFAPVSLSYKVNAGQNGSGLVKAELYKPRTTRYTLVPETLSFEQTKSGDIILPAGTVISIAIPPSAEKIYFSSIPENVAEEGEEAFKYDTTNNVKYYIGSKRVFTWASNTLSKFRFTYEAEAPLESEVIGAFRDSQSTVISFLTGAQGLAALILIGASAVSLYSLNRLGK